MSSPEVRKLAARLANIETEQRAQATSAQLAHSSIEDGALSVNDGDGFERALLGRQLDGTVAVTFTNGPTPGAPAAPFVAAHQLSFLVQWDGMFEVGQNNPRDLAHIEVHVSEEATDGQFEPSLATLVGTIPPEGGALTVTGDNDEHYVCIRALTTSGEYGPPSDFQSVTPLPVDVVIGDELIGKIITGGVIRTAPDGARIQLDASESTRDLSFYSASGGRAVIRQETFAGGPGITFISENVDVAGEDYHTRLNLEPDRLSVLYEASDGTPVMSELTVGQSSVGIVAGGLAGSSVSLDAETAVIAAGDNAIRVGEIFAGFTNRGALLASETGAQMWTDATGSAMQSADAAFQISSYDAGIFIGNVDGLTSFGTSPGNPGQWRLYGTGDAGGATGGILQIIDSDPLVTTYMELDANEIQTNPFDSRLHLNLAGGAGNGGLGFAESGVTITDGLLIEKDADGSPRISHYHTQTGRDVGLRFGPTNNELWVVGRPGSSGARVIRASAFTPSSDPGIKADVRPLAGALDEVLAAPAYSYVVVDDDPELTRRGVMSVDLDEGMVTPADEDHDLPAGVDLYGLVATLWSAVRELAQRVEAQT